MSAREETALALFAGGYNCAQAVLGAFCEESGLDLSTALKLASGFGGGMRCGEVCGAVTGAVMVIGLQCGFYKEKDFEQKNFCNQKALAFMEAFARENGSVLCRKLLGAENFSTSMFSDPASRELFQTICPEMVASAVRLLENMEFER